MKEYKSHKFKALSIINGEELGEEAIEVFSPANFEDIVGEVSFIDPAQAVSALMQHMMHLKNGVACQFLIVLQY